MSAPPSAAHGLTHKPSPSPSPSTDINPSALIARLYALSPLIQHESNKEARAEAVQLSKALTAELQPPENPVMELGFSPIAAACASIAVKLNLLQFIVAHEPVTSARLAQLSGAEELLIQRILRLLAAVQFVRETAPNTWAATRITRFRASREVARVLDGMEIMGPGSTAEFIMTLVQNAPAYFSSREKALGEGEGQGKGKGKGKGYTSPTDPHDGILQHAFNTKLTTFEYIASNPVLLNSFNKAMTSHVSSRKSWAEFYPVQERMLDGVSSNSDSGEKALLVDIGGGRGHDILAFSRKFPRAGESGRLILEDLEQAVSAEDLDDDEGKIERVTYDFFTEQPVVGARVYFYHHIFHDWSDEYCLRILERVVPAMTRGYSKLLIVDMVVPDHGASLLYAQMDITLMAFNGGIERTRAQWEGLLKKAGLEIAEIFDAVDEGGDAIIEAVRV